MASSWSKAWASAWGDSWGMLIAAVRPVAGGKRRRRILLPPGYAPIPRPYRPKEDDEALLLCRVV